MWIPVLALAQRSHSFYDSSLRFLFIVSLRWLLVYSSAAWANKTWSVGFERIDWTEQIVLITGGSDGLGRVIAETLAVKHVTVVVLDIKPFATDSESEDVHFYECDVSKPEVVETVADRVRAEVGHPTIIINNAGLIVGKLIIDLAPDDVQRTFGVNVLSHFSILKAFLPEMIAQKTGHVVTIASVLGSIGVSQASDYCASKAASISLHNSLRLELDSRHNCPRVRTTLVTPGRLETKMFQKIVKPQNGFFFPSVAPHDLAKLVIQDLDSHLSSHISVPLYTNAVWMMAGMPSWVKDLVHWCSGSNHAMLDLHNH
ncbi:hypothetical protein CROQUDRAFT_700925 [Cronartium quercuum f. sp. fusiforme G11]|uniref:Short-chain dehydrogenase/reductase 3 n=1 Tax=Cronartium quercuum f. sp. fusiforme G11 TaxID=708437 RepID=A0A9P6NIZ4_9BASI|nr:hypothetical protein CROQUDRAFT_700925 [Cronartium quercuum f. sp. fusiforme G11]